MSSYISKRVLCPFYRDVKHGQVILCEGIKDNSAVHLAYERKADCTGHMEKYCCCNYNACVIAGVLNKKYSK